MLPTKTSLAVSCPYCFAYPGEPCISTVSTDADYVVPLHTERDILMRTLIATGVLAYVDAGVEVWEGNAQP